MWVLGVLNRLSLDHGGTRMVANSGERSKRAMRASAQGRLLELMVLIAVFAGSSGASAALARTSPATSHDSPATTKCAGPGDFGAQYLSSAWPGGFAGVRVLSDGGGYVTNCYNYARTPSGKSVKSGMEWQCVELINRLYITKGWINSTWMGDG